VLTLDHWIICEAMNIADELLSPSGLSSSPT
jgi:hypothetical protein